jgi:hypothetical protein
MCDACRVWITAFGAMILSSETIEGAIAYLWHAFLIVESDDDTFPSTNGFI